MRRGLVWCAILAAAVPCPAQQDRRPHGTPGDFDYYLLTMSWSPQFCLQKPNDPQCRMHLGFVLHGYWPEKNSGDFPHNCPTDLRATPSMSHHVPGSIVQHEWQTHGACVAPSETPQAYFQEADARFESIQVPPELANPKAPLTLSLDSLVTKFVNANPGMRPENLSPHCLGANLQDVRVCLGKGSGYAACTVPTTCSRNRPIRIAPVK